VVTAGGGRLGWWTLGGAELGVIPLEYSAERLVIDAGGRWLFVSGVTSSLQVVDLAARRTTTHLAIRDWHAVAVAADASRVAIGDDQSIRLWRLGTWEPAGELVGHRNQVSDLWFLSDGRLVSLADDTALVWGRDHRLRGRLADGERVYYVAAPGDATFIATIGSEGAIKIWDGATYHKLLVLPSHRLPSLAIQVTHDGASVLSAGRDGRFVTWQLDHPTRSPSALADIVRCRVPLRLEGDVALPRDLDFDDPTCAARP
jgi:WD40 repeat protein